VQRFTPPFADAARFARHSSGDRWFVDETYVKVNGVWRYVYRAVDQYGPRPRHLPGFVKEIPVDFFSAVPLGAAAQGPFVEPSPSGP
jgi:hypothetical protein